MPKKQKTSKQFGEVQNSMRVASWFLLVFFVVVVCGILIWRLYQLQVVDGEDNQYKAAAQQLLDVEITPQRGQIYSSTGKVLAKSSIVWTITADPSQIKAPKAAEGDTSTDEQRRTARVQAASGEIAEILGLEYTEVYDKLINAEKQYVVLAKQVDKPVADAIKTYASDNSLSITISQDTKREYPYGAFAASVLGFMHVDGYGFYGLEKYYEETLAGVPGRTISIKNRWGTEIINDESTTVPAQDGYSLVTTIDENIQAILEKYLENSVKANNVTERGVAIAMDANTGAILGMAIKPDFDPNEPMLIYDADLAATLEGLEGEEYTKTQGDARQRQWKNKAITDLYTPGSVFKVISAAAALDSGTSTIYSTYNCSGSYGVATETYGCAQSAVHGTQTIGTILCNSCNIGTIQMIQRLGIDGFSEYYKGFGFTEATGIDLPAEQQNREGISYHSADNMSIVDLASSSFGQAQKVTAVQMTAAIAAAVNGGYLVQPHVVSQIVDSEGNLVEDVTPSPKRQVISETTSAAIRDMMESVVDGGRDGAGGRNAYVAGYRIGGKSGTTEKLDKDSLRDDGDYEKVSSFVGVVPIDNPEVVILVLLDEPHAETDFGSMLSAPLVGNIISELAPYLGLETDPNYNPIGTVTVPDLVNNKTPEWDMAQVSLNKLGLAHRKLGNGPTVLAQYPVAGTKVPAGTTVYLYTDTTQMTQVTVPDVLGREASLAQQVMQAAGLNVQMEGAAEGKVVSQSIAADTSVDMGTIVTITIEASTQDAP